MLPGLPEALARDHLFVSGALHEGTQTVLLLSPDEPGFWAHVTAQPEFDDGVPDPLDRWSSRVITALAAQFGAQARFPFTGPPWHPFVRWAIASGQSFASPIHLMVHARMGLWASMRGALVLPMCLPLPAPAANPCIDCAAPCTTACPVAALGPQGYDVPACHAHLASAEGDACRNSGCLARRACPAGESYGRLAKQSAWHMRQFHP
ncbi:ferredoxin [Thioclava sp. 15-R06ZXC-3]|uniref:Ferredoxin n=1 Tax=Thioclava arctica TaxID=3238301 RepID=A0ABV3TEE8_9RHOB